MPRFHNDQIKLGHYRPRTTLIIALNFTLELPSYFNYDVSTMQDTFTTLSSKGQVVIPAELREKLGIEAGTRMAVRIEKDRLILEPITEAYIRSLRGSLKGPVSMVAARNREHRLEK